MLSSRPPTNPFGALALLALVLAVALAALLPAPARAETYPTLTQIQSAASDSGWTAGSNPIWNLSWTEKGKRLGFIVPSEDEEDLGPRSHVIPADSLPA
ncbi:MAG TPA: hypothetical protein VE960_05505, partial [bacterium]|nr:hypothetical protein [bacterium]